MTTEYLRGEVMLLLAWAQRAVPCDREAEQALAALSREAQSSPLGRRSSGFWELARPTPAPVGVRLLDNEDLSGFLIQPALLAALIANSPMTNSPSRS